MFHRFCRLAALSAACVFLLAPAPVQAQDAVAKTAEVPFRADAGLITAEYYLATGKYAQALDVLGGVLTRHPQNADAFTYRGFAYQQLGDTKKARENYARAVAISPSHLGAQKYLGSLHLQDGNLSRAMEQMQALLYICAGTHCAETDELQSEINAFKNSSKSAP